VGPRIGLVNVENRIFLTLPGLELLPLRRPARSQSPYRLRCDSAVLSVIKRELITEVLMNHIIRPRTRYFRHT
jgi:hypothetical protein